MELFLTTDKKEINLFNTLLLNRSTKRQQCRNKHIQQKVFFLL